MAQLNRRNVLAGALSLAALPASGQSINVLQWVDAWHNGAPLYPTSGYIIDEATAKGVIANNAALCAGLGYTVNELAADHSLVRYTDPASGITIRQSYVGADPWYTTPTRPLSGAIPNLAPIATPSIGAGTAGLFVFGQSNADRSGRGRYTSPHPRCAAYGGQGRFYQLSDPIPGGLDASADAGPWTRVAERLIDHALDPRHRNGALIDSVIVRSAAIGGSVLEAWMPGGHHHQYLIDQIADCRRHGVPITHLLFVLGEGSGSLTTAQWVAGFMAVLAAIRTAGVTCPIWVAQTTLCRLRDAANPLPMRAINRRPDQFVSAEQGYMRIRAAQAAVLNGVDIRAGANLDVIPPQRRGDGCHCDADAMAEAWLPKLIA